MSNSETILITGADGFIGRNVSGVIRSAYADTHNVALATRSGADNTVQVDLMDADDVSAHIKDINPSIVVHCAGVVGGDNFDPNWMMTQNIANAMVALDPATPRKVIISGSAGVYGQVESVNQAVSEDFQLNGSSPYALSKIKEEHTLRDITKNSSVAGITARIFNPIGTGMSERFLLSSLLKQVKEIQSGKRTTIELGRIDSYRDYIHVEDVATALGMIATADQLDFDVYNVGSGVATSNLELVQLLLDNFGITADIKIHELNPDPEPIYAARADITRIQSSLSWKPQYTIATAIERIIRDAK